MGSTSPIRWPARRGRAGGAPSWAGGLGRAMLPPRVAAAVPGTEQGIHPPPRLPTSRKAPMEAHPHAHVEHQKTGHRTLDAVVSVCAMITSAVSILLAYHTGHNMERLVHASSWPALQLATGNGSTRDGLQLDFAVINAGVGPAQIHTLEFLCDGATVAWTQDVEKLLEACCAEAVGQARAAAGKRWEPQVSTAPV